MVNMKTGLLHPMQVTRDFDEWRMYIKEGFIRVVFRKKNGRRCLFTSPFCPYIKENTGDTFSPKMNDTEWQIFDEEFKILFERQKTKYPQQHKKQKSDTIIGGKSLSNCRFSLCYKAKRTVGFSPIAYNVLRLPVRRKPRSAFERFHRWRVDAVSSSSE